MTLKIPGSSPSTYGSIASGGASASVPPPNDPRGDAVIALTTRSMSPKRSLVSSKGALDVVGITGVADEREHAGQLAREGIDRLLAACHGSHVPAVACQLAAPAFVPRLRAPKMSRVGASVTAT